MCLLYIFLEYYIYITLWIENTDLIGTEIRGGCTRCGMLGHLTFQCRNPPLKQEVDEVRLRFVYIYVYMVYIVGIILCLYNLILIKCSILFFIVYL